MDVEGIRKYFKDGRMRPIGLVVAACAALALPIGWTAWQSRLTHEALRRAAEAERAAAQARADVDRSQAISPARPPKDPMVRRSRHDDPEARERVRQLYEEVEALSQMQQHVEDKLGREPPIRLKLRARDGAAGAKAK